MSFLRINTNSASIAAQRALENNALEMESALARLSSGSRITKASDDAAGLALSELMKAQIKGLRAAERNAQDGISLVQVAEGGLNEANNILVRLRELSIQAGSESIGDKEREFIDYEVQQLKAELDRIAATTELSGRPLLNGEGSEISFQVGIKGDESSTITFDTSGFDVRTKTLEIDDLNVLSVDDAQDSLEYIDEAISRIVQARSEFGAAQSRFNSVTNTINVQTENLSAANSRIRDANIAEETSRLVRTQVLSEAALATIAASNANASRAIKLIA